jgi:diguanylate cyclase (GGDEF)-like protein/PAS domain S-box-containing protein
LNAAFCRLLGYSEHELLGMNNQRYQSPEVAARVFETFNEVYRTGAPKIGHDWELIRKDGSKVLVEASVNLIRDSQGKATGFRGMLRDVTARREAEQRIEYLATHDELTGLPNRVMFGELLKLAIESARRHERRFAVLFIDLDGFKTVNDTLGHEAGDALLKRISARLKDCLRASDVVARQGGDEFVVLVEEVTDTGEVTAVARKILAGVIESASLAGHDCGVTASVGISMYPADARDEKSLMKSADIAMYLAKERGKNNFQFVSSSIETPGDPLRAMAR